MSRLIEHPLGIVMLLVISIISVMIIFLIIQSIPILLYRGLEFLITSSWNPVKEEYGILFALGGSVVVGLISVALGAVLSISLAVFVAEISPVRLRSIFVTLNDIGAAVPTVIYGLWGLIYLAPFLYDYVMAPLSTFLSNVLGVPSRPGTSIFTASVLMAIMIVPFSSAIIREGLLSIPTHLREAIISIGATKWELIWIQVKMVKNYIIGGLLIGFGRAVGETVAVAMVVGNVIQPEFYKIFLPGYTVSSLIADQYQNAEAYTYMVSALFAASLFIFIVGLLANMVGLSMVRRK